MDKISNLWGINDGLFYPEIHVDETDLCSIAHQFNGAVYFEFSHNIVAVIFNHFYLEMPFMIPLSPSLCHIILHQSCAWTII